MTSFNSFPESLPTCAVESRCVPLQVIAQRHQHVPTTMHVVSHASPATSTDNIVQGFDLSQIVVEPLIEWCVTPTITVFVLPSAQRVGSTPLPTQGSSLAVHHPRPLLLMCALTAALQQYAVEHGLQVTTIYRDKGKSGLTLEGRTGLLQLLTDIQAGHADFNIVFVYDVSRWGRFQDVDESAYYEYAYRRAGIALAYCAEPFSNDG